MAVVIICLLFEASLKTTSAAGRIRLPEAEEYSKELYLNILLPLHIVLWWQVQLLYVTQQTSLLEDLPPGKVGWNLSQTWLSNKLTYHA